MKKQRLPTDWTDKHIRELAAYHDGQTEEQQADEIETALDGWNKRSRQVRLKPVREARDGRPKDCRASLD
jgi:hypothetical protein